MNCAADNLPRIGDSIRLWMGNLERRAVVLAYNASKDSALLRFPDYDLPDEWYPTRRL